MAKDTPTKPGDVKASSAAEHPEQAAPIAGPPAAEMPKAVGAAVSTDTINALADDKRKESKPKQPSQDEQGQEAPAGKAVQTREKAAHTPEQASAPGVVNPVSEAGTSTLSADEDFRAEWEIPLAELEERRKQEKKARRSSSKKAPAAKEAEAAEKPDKPADKVVPLHPSDSDDKPRREQEALLHMLDEKGASLSRLKNFSPVKSKPSAPGKAQPASDSPELAERKRKLEKELREKYGIPKSDTPAKPWVAPEEEKVVRIPHEKLHPFKGHTFNVEKNAKFMAFVASIRAHGVTQPVIVRPDGKDTYEIISGHRRDQGGIEAGIPYSPCIVRALNDEQAIQQMVEDTEIYPPIPKEYAKRFTVNGQLLPGYTVESEQEKQSVLGQLAKAKAQAQERFRKGDDFRQPPYLSPWGKLMGYKTLCPGVFQVKSAEHSGIMVANEVSALLSPYLCKQGERRGGFLCFENETAVMQELSDKKLLQGQKAAALPEKMSKPIPHKASVER